MMVLYTYIYVFGQSDIDKVSVMNGFYVDDLCIHFSSSFQSLENSRMRPVLPMDVLNLVLDEFMFTSRETRR